MKKPHATHRNKKDSAPQAGLVAAMSRADFYPDLPARVAHKQTHISHIFLTDKLVYKLKKAVRYSFLDYSTVANRRHFLNEELRLNRRLAPSVYLDVLPITKIDRRFKLAGGGTAVDHVLVMNRLPDAGMMPSLLERDGVTPEMMRELAATLAKFHSQADRVEFKDPPAYPIVVQKQWDANLADLDPLIGSSIDAEDVRALKEFGATFIKEQKDLLINRAEEGWIRDVHGDLHCENICFAADGVQVFDCIEFSSEFRHCDLASEIAFLLMDLEARGAKHLVARFLKDYCDLMDDTDLPRLLPFYKSYRAIVRGKVQALRGDRNAAERYFKFATRYAKKSLDPFVVIVCGLSGSGKSTLARELGKRLNLSVINSDVVRKRLAGKAGPQAVALNTGIYTPTMTQKTYASMAREAEGQLASGNGVILDATFLFREQRQPFVRLARKYGVPLFLIHCTVSKVTTKQRLFKRTLEGTDVSDGRWEIYLEQLAAEEPFDDFPADGRLELNTGAPLEELGFKTEDFLLARLRSFSDRS